MTAASRMGTGGLQLAFAALAVPGVVAMVLLVVTRRHMPIPTDTGPSTPASPAVAVEDQARLPASFWWLATGAGFCTAGLVTYGLIGFHLVEQAIVPAAGVPLLYAAAMASGALAALATGGAYDRFGGRILLVLPFLIAAVPVLAFGASLTVVLPGVVLWGAAFGIQDSTVKALVADLVTRGRRATAYGWFAAVQGIGALIGGVAAGALYQQSVSALVVGVIAMQAVAIAILLMKLRPNR